MIDDNRKLIEVSAEIKELVDGMPVTHVLTVLTHTASHVAIPAGLDRDAFLRGCAGAFDAVRGNLQ